MAADVVAREPRRQLRPALTTALLGFVVAFVVVAPWMRRGWLLLLDWVPGPRGIGPTGGAALPTGPGFLGPVAVMHSVFGAAVGWLPIAVVIVIATTGAATLVGGAGPARVAAGIAYGWNPFVFDRLAVGQISVLAGYALLPWVLRAALRARDARGALGAGAFWALAASCTLHFVWIGGLLLVCVAFARRREFGARPAARGFVLACLVLATVVGGWLLLDGRGAPAPGDTRVLSTFATAPDPDLGRSLGLLAEQGFWRPVVTRPRDDLGVAFPLVAVGVIAAAGVGLFATRRSARTASVALAAAGGWILAHGATGPFGALYRAGFEYVPGFGVMREAQKWDALVCLAIAVGLGAGAARLHATGARRRAWLVAALPIALAPTLAWGLAGRIEPSHYPRSWQGMQRAIAATPGGVVVLPWQQYTAPGVTGNRAIANPVRAYFGNTVTVSRDPEVPGLDADTGRAARVGSAVRATAAAAASGQVPALGPALTHLGFGGVLAVGDDDRVLLDRDPSLVVRARADFLTLYAAADGTDRSFRTRPRR